jgi:hypothetical protein
MGELVDRFAGKVSGELIRASDWNGLIAAIEVQLESLEARLGDRVAGLETDLAAAGQRIEDLGARVDPLQGLATALRTRLRRVDLRASRASFAIGERAEITAQVTDIEGRPLALADAAARPWVDFVTVWGALKAAPGFLGRGGASSRTVTVQVDAQGQARVLLRAEHADAFAEEQEQEVSAVLSTSIGSTSVASAFLDAPTPGSTDLAAAYAVVSQAYERADTRVVQAYLDTYYVRAPVVSVGATPGIFALNWRDHHATVMAFVKPDDSPTTADGAQAVGSIRVTFRDWVYPWIVTQYLPPRASLTDVYRGRFRQAIRVNFEPSISGIFDVIQTRSVDRGLIGRQQELLAAREALASLDITDPPSFLPSLVQTVSGSLALQQGLAFSQAVTPLLAQDAGAARTVGMATAQGQAVARQEVAAIRLETDRRLNETEGRVAEIIQAETSRVTSELLREGGPVRRAETLAISASSQVEQVNRELGQKAGLEIVSQLLAARGGG